MKKIIAALVGGLTLATAAVAAPVITSYDITNASLPGFGGWNHYYTGTVSGTTYTGGSGTLNDGNYASSEQETQLFGNAGATTISLFLDQLYTVDALSIFGGNYTHNGIPGTLTGMTVTIGTTSVALQSSDFGLNGDLINFAGTGLNLLSTDRIVLSNFTGTFYGYVSIAEINVGGSTAQAPADVPEPASLALLGLGALAAFGAIKRKKA
jgi:hypothetical protein